MTALSDTALRRIGYGLCTLAAVLGVIAVQQYAAAGNGQKLFESILLPTTFAAVIIVLLRAVPRHGLTWALIALISHGTIHEGAVLLATNRIGSNPDDMWMTSLTPASLPLFDALLVSFVQWAWLWFATLMIPIMVLFPTGRPTTWLSKLTLWVSVIVTFVASTVAAFSLGPWVETPYSELLSGGGWLPLVGDVFLGIGGLLALTVGDLTWRFWRSSGIERLQFRWVATALTAFVISMLLPIPLVFLGVDLPDIAFSLAPTLALIAIPVSIGIAISRYRLFDIDLVISRTLLFVAMAALITLLYAGVVVGLGSLVGGSTLVWRIVVTALVAVLFEPVRHRVQRRVNHLVFGRRAAPYEVLTDITGRLAATTDDDELLAMASARLAEGTGAERAAVWVAEGSGFRLLAEAPTISSAERPSESPSRPLDELPGIVVPIVDGGETLGALSVEPRRGVSLTTTEHRLVEDLAGSVGLVMRRVALDAELRQKAALLGESRRRLVNAQELERRRLQRRLDEDAQQRVVAVRAKLDGARDLARREGADRTAALIDQMAVETDDAIQQIDALVQGLHPPLLEAEGLDAALTALADSAPVEVRIEAASTGRHPLSLEAAAYFCISEAVTNALKHGRGPISIEVVADPAELSFTVADAGPGFDPATAPRGAGLGNMVDRVEQLHGSLAIDSKPGRSTVVRGRLPVTEPAPVAVGALSEV